MRDASGAAFVLPRLLREPFRFAVRMFQGNINVPRYAGTIGMLSFLGATGIYGMSATPLFNPQKWMELEGKFTGEVKKYTIVGNDVDPLPEEYSKMVDDEL